MLVTQSSEIPFTHGTLSVYTEQGPIILLLLPGRPGNRLTIQKTSSDAYPIALYSEEVQVDDADIVIFGRHDDHGIGTVRSLTLEWKGHRWITVHQE